MKQKLLIILLLTFSIGCKQKAPYSTSDNNSSLETTFKIDSLKNTLVEPVDDKPILKENIKSEKVEFDKYLTSFKDSTVSLCCLQELYNPFGELTPKRIKSYLKEYSISKESDGGSEKDIFKKDSSLVTLVNYKAEYSENVYELFLGKGILYDSSIELDNGIKIGISKQKFMTTFFQFSDTIINNLNQVSVCQDERGSSFTKYKFKNDKLVHIKFGEWDEFD